MKSYDNKIKQRQTALKRAKSEWRKQQVDSVKQIKQVAQAQDKVFKESLGMSRSLRRNQAMTRINDKKFKQKCEQRERADRQQKHHALITSQSAGRIDCRLNKKELNKRYLQALEEQVKQEENDKQLSLLLDDKKS